MARELLQRHASPIPQGNIERSTYSAALEAGNFSFIRMLLSHYVPTRGEAVRLLARYKHVPSEICEWILQNTREEDPSVQAEAEPEFVTNCKVEARIVPQNSGKHRLKPKANKIAQARPFSAAPDGRDRTSPIPEPKQGPVWNAKCEDRAPKNFMLHHIPSLALANSSAEQKLPNGATPLPREETKSSETLIREINELLRANSAKLQRISARLRNLNGVGPPADPGATGEYQPEMLPLRPTLTLEASPVRPVIAAAPPVGQSCKNAQDKYFAYLSPENGGGWSELQAAGAPSSLSKEEQRTAESPTCAGSKGALTPAYKILDVPPYMVRDRAKHAKKLVDGMNRQREVRAKLSSPALPSRADDNQRRKDHTSAMRGGHGRKKAPTATPDLASPSGRPASCATPRAAGVQSRSRQQKQQQLPSGQKSERPITKTVLSKYCCGPVLHVQQLEFYGKRGHRRGCTNGSSQPQGKDMMTLMKLSMSQGSEEEFGGYLSEPRINAAPEDDSSSPRKHSPTDKRKSQALHFGKLNITASTPRSFQPAPNNPSSVGRPLTSFGMARKPEPKLETSPLGRHGKIAFPLFMRGKADGEPSAGGGEGSPHKRIFTFEEVLMSRRAVNRSSSAPRFQYSRQRRRPRTTRTHNIASPKKGCAVTARQQKEPPPTLSPRQLRDQQRQLQQQQSNISRETIDAAMQKRSQIGDYLGLLASLNVQMQSVKAGMRPQREEPRPPAVPLKRQAFLMVTNTAKR